MIQEGYKLDFRNQTFGVILYGAPGVGKTTLAMSDGKCGADLGELTTSNLGQGHDEGSRLAFIEIIPRGDSA